MTDQALLTSELQRFARKLVTDYPVSDALHDLAEAATSILGLLGAGVCVAHEDRLVCITATAEDIAELEKLQEQDQSGPCVEAFESGKPILISDLAVAVPHWPVFTSSALQRGIGSAAAIPLHLDGARLGALDLYDVTAHAWIDSDMQTAELLAAMATGYLVNASRLHQVQHTAEQLQVALDSRVIIEQAKGVLAGERSISVDEAFSLIRGHARSHGVPLHDVAHAVVTLGLRPDPRRPRRPRPEEG